ncbi:hypothetical protein JL720_8996 [Aureococcus anophagefferens]|nr:hypothetical protein JL720_8996 [Aureococcus anophagefferens]
MTMLKLLGVAGVAAAVTTDLGGRHLHITSVHDGDGRYTNMLRSDGSFEPDSRRWTGFFPDLIRRVAPLANFTLHAASGAARCGAPSADQRDHMSAYNCAQGGVGLSDGRLLGHVARDAGPQRLSRSSSWSCRRTARHRAATLLRRTDGLLNALRSRRRWWHERDASKFLLSAFVEDVRRGAAGVHEELRRPLLDYYLTTDMVAWKALKKALTTLTDLLAKLEGADGERPAENFDRLHKGAADAVADLARRAAHETLVAHKLGVARRAVRTSRRARRSSKSASSRSSQQPATPKKKKRKAAGPPAKVAELSECAACENWASDATAFVRAKVRHRLNPPPAPAPGEPVGLEPTWKMRLNRTCRSGCRGAVVARPRNAALIAELRT